MAHSLEVRSPFLDKDLIEFGLSLPMDIKIRKFTSKSLLRDLASSYLPKDVYSAPKKGFEIPLDVWLRIISLVWCRIFLTAKIQLLMIFLKEITSMRFHQLK